MHKARYAMPPLEPFTANDECFETFRFPKIRFFLVNSAYMLVRGPFQEYVKRIYPHEIPPHHIVMPVHSLQVPNIQQRFPFAQLLDFEVPARSQASTRSVVPDNDRSISLKLPLGVKITSALRTVTHWTTYQGPGIGEITDEIVDSDALLVIKEVASAVVRDHNPDSAKHFSCIFRDHVQEAENVECDFGMERLIVCAALVETEVNNDCSRVVSVFNLNTEQERIRFLEW